MSSGKREKAGEFVKWRDFYTHTEVIARGHEKDPSALEKASARFHPPQG